ncbi:MAG: hypothetical protein CL927_02400 [Deltaproteobacteria bacterium]|nr:hypothetical protein [Deltaproteobacteria bacterium]HCH64647.1 hypothetical protein [Deltaproteobacteria bacterium]
MSWMTWGVALWLGVAHAEPMATVPAEAGPATAEHGAQWNAITAELVLQVDDREACLDEAVAVAQARGGWFAELGTERVALRVPVHEVSSMVDDLRGLGDLVERSYASENLSPEVVDLQSRLQTRREILSQYTSVLAEASPKAVVSVERQITNVVAEIETLEGRLRVLNDRAQYARVVVRLRFRERRAPMTDGSSSFAWLETLNVSDLLDDMALGVRGPVSGAAVTAPQGFASWRSARRFQAVSPDDVVFRVRRARNKPQADLAYWQEALRNRMKNAGYTLLAEADISASGTPGVLLELGAADGERDQTYLLCVFVSGRRLIIAEATGESTRFRARRDAVVAAIEAMRIP